MTSLQEDPSAQAPCTSTTLRACAGAAGCDSAGAAKSIAVTMPSAMTVDFRSVFIAVSPRVMSSKIGFDDFVDSGIEPAMQGRLIRGLDGEDVDQGDGRHTATSSQEALAGRWHSTKRRPSPTLTV